MFNIEDDIDKYGNPQMSLALTQGDSCTIISTPYNSDDTFVSPELISVVKFKIYQPKTRDCLFSKVMPLYNGNSYRFKMTPEESNRLPVGKYRYEIEYTFINGDINTANQYTFEITEQALCQNNL